MEKRMNQRKEAAKRWTMILIWKIVGERLLSSQPNSKTLSPKALTFKRESASETKSPPSKAA